MWLQMAYTIDVVKTNVAEALEILADSVLNPKFNSWEVQEQFNKLEKDLKSMKSNPQNVLLEVGVGMGWSGGRVVGGMGLCMGVWACGC